MEWVATLGLKSRSFDDNQQDFLSLEYANGCNTIGTYYSLLTLISRYSGANIQIMLHFINSEANNGLKQRERAAEALYDVAAELLEIYAKRESQKGFAYPEPTDSYSSFVC